MSDPFGWFPRDEGERRERERLRDFHEDVLWLAANASPDAWERGIESMQRSATEARTCLERLRAAHLRYFVQREMPRRDLNASELREMKALIARMFEPDNRESAMGDALKNPNPAWQLRCLRRVVARLERI